MSSDIAAAGGAIGLGILASKDPQEAAKIMKMQLIFAGVVLVIGLGLFIWIYSSHQSTVQKKNLPCGCSRVLEPGTTSRS
jgi:hypothetical protein